MNFDWQQSTKEKYFLKAEKMTKAAGLEHFLLVDRSKFAITKDKVKVFFLKVRRAGNSRRLSEAKRLIEGIQEMPGEKDELTGKRIKSVFIDSYVVLDMEEQDK